jgi:hypothetical protein
MANTEAMHHYDLSDCFGEASHDGRTNVYHRRLNPLGKPDRLLERLYAVHGCRRFDLPRELLKSFDMTTFAREYLYRGQ